MLQPETQTSQTPPKCRRAFTRVLIAGFLLVGLAVLSATGWYLAVTQLPIHPETATQTQLVQWLVLRNFAAEPLAMQDSLADRFEVEFGMSSGKMPQFTFSETTQRIIRSVTGKQTTAKNAKNSDSKARSDHNATILIRRLVERSCLAYTSAPRDQRNAVVQRVAAQLAWWEQLQVTYCNAIGIAPPTQAELMEEFEEIFHDIIIAAPEHERAAIKQYRTILIAVIVLRHIRQSATVASGLAKW